MPPSLCICVWIDKKDAYDEKKKENYLKQYLLAFKLLKPSTYIVHTCTYTVCGVKHKGKLSGG